MIKAIRYSILQAGWHSERNELMGFGHRRHQLGRPCHPANLHNNSRKFVSSLPPGNMRLPGNKIDRRTFQAVKEKVFPADPMRMQQSCIPGRLRNEMCLLPSNTRCSYTCQHKDASSSPTAFEEHFQTHVGLVTIMREANSSPPHLKLRRHPISGRGLQCTADPLTRTPCQWGCEAN